MESIKNLYGTSNSSFQIGMGGPTIYAGTADPSITPPTPATGYSLVNGDLYVRKQTGSEAIWQYTSGVWDAIPGANGGTFNGNVIVNGNFTVNGTLTTINTTTLDIADPILTLNTGDAGPGVTTRYAGLTVDRGSSTAVNWLWDESNQYWAATGPTGTKNLGVLGTATFNGLVSVNNANVQMFTAASSPQIGYADGTTTWSQGLQTTIGYVIANNTTLGTNNRLILLNTGGAQLSGSLSINGATIGTNAFAVSGTTSLGGALTYGGVTLNNAVTGTGSMVLSASPTLSGTIGGALTFSGGLTLSSALTYGGVTLANSVSGTGPMVLGTAPSISGLTVTGSFSATGLVTNADLTNSTITLGTTAMSLGSSYTTIAGAITWTGPQTLSAALTYGGVTLANSVSGTGSMVLSASPTLSGTIGGALSFSGALTFSSALTYGGVTLNNAVTGIGSMVLSASPTLSGTIGGALSFSGALTLSSALTYGGVTLNNSVTGTGNMVLSASPTITGTLTASTISASSISTTSLSVNGNVVAPFTVGSLSGTNNVSSLLAVGPRGNPATTGSTADGIARFAYSTSVQGLDLGVTATPSTPAAWVQSRNPGNYSTNYDLWLNPNGGNVSVGYTSSQTALLAVNGSFSAATINGLTITSSTGTLTIASGKTLSVNNSITLAGTDSSTLTLSASLTTTGAGAPTLSFPGSSYTYIFPAASGTVSLSGSGAVSSVSNSDSSLTISPTTGAVVAGLNLGHTNSWTTQQNFRTISITSGNWLYFNGTSDTNWRTGLGTSFFTTTRVGATTSVQTVTGGGTGGPDGWAVGTTGGTSTIEIVGNTNTFYVTGAGGLNVAQSTVLSGTITYGGVTLANSVTGTGSMVLSASPTLSGTVGGALTFSGALTLSSALTYGGVTLNNAVTGTGNMVLSASPTLSGTIGGALTFSGALTLSSALTYGGVTLANSVTGTGSMVLSASPTFTGTLTGATANFTGLVSSLGSLAGYNMADRSTSGSATWARVSGTTSLFDAFGAIISFNGTSGLTTIQAALNYGGVTLSNSVSGTGSMVLSNAPILISPVLGVATGTSLSTTSAHTAFSGTAIPAGGTAGAGYLLSSTANFGIFFGSGLPTLSANQGSIYLRSDGTPYYNSSSGSGTTWTQIGSGGGSGTVTSSTGGQLAWYASTGTTLIGNANLTISSATLNLGPTIGLTTGGSTTLGYLLSSTTNFGLYGGTGAPTISAAQGSIYLRSDGAPYYNSSSGSGTTWTQIGSGAGSAIASKQSFNGDGATTAFTLSGSPVDIANLEVFVHGLRQTPTTDYTLSGSTLTFTTAPPVGTANIFCNWANNYVLGSNTLNTFNGDGATTSFTLSVAPGTINNTQVYIEGIYQQKSTYTVIATTLSFGTAPPSGTNNIECLIGPVTGGSSGSVNTGTATQVAYYPSTGAAVSGNASVTISASTSALSAPEFIATNGIVSNSTTISTSYTIPSGNSAMSVGPITLSPGVGVTISSGSRWVIL